MTQKWKSATVEKLITSLQQYPCLFNVKSAEYLDRTKKAQAWNNIMEELLKSDGTLNLQEIKRKWRNLRVQFMQEQRQINSSKKSGSGMTDVYVPKLWCYEQLCFLRTYVDVRTSNDNIETTSAESTISDFGEEDNLSQEPPKKKHKNPINSIRNDLHNFKNVLTAKKEKKFAWLGNLVASQMEEVQPEGQSDAAWQVQCLMRRLTSTPSESTISASSPKDILEMSIEGLFDDEDFSTLE